MTGAGVPVVALRVQGGRAPPLLAQIGEFCKLARARLTADSWRAGCLKSGGGVHAEGALIFKVLGRGWATCHSRAQSSPWKMPRVRLRASCFGHVRQTDADCRDESAPLVLEIFGG